MVDLATYLFVCVLLTLLGRALLHVGRTATTDPVFRLLLAPCVGQAAWAVFLGIGILAGMTVKTLAPALWILTVAAAIYGGYLVWTVDVRGDAADTGRQRWRGVTWLAIALLLAILVTLPHFVFGPDFPGSRLSDGWAYAAYAQYLWELPRGTAEGLGPLHQFGFALSHTRYVASSEMGILSWLTAPGDPQTAGMLLQSVGTFCLAAGVLAFGWLRLSWHMLLPYAVLTIFSGWCLNLLWANNHDNLLALAYFPALVALGWSCFTGSERLSSRCAALLGLLAAGLIYTYIEFALVILAATALVIVERLWRAPSARSGRGFFVVLAVLVVLSGPYAVDGAWYLYGQFGEGMRVDDQRPGRGMFLGLITHGYRLPAFWALTAEHRVETGRVLQYVGAVCLSVVAVAGVVHLFVRREVALTAILAGSAGAAWFFIVVDPYSYGAYKVVLLAWWLIAYAVVTGVSWMAGTGGSWTRWAIVPVLIVGTIAIPVVAMTRLAQQLTTPHISMNRFRSLEEVSRLIPRQPVAVFVDDAEASHWAMYYLRRQPLQMGQFAGYPALPRFLPVMLRAEHRPWNVFRYVLTEAGRSAPVDETATWLCIWKSEAFALWDTGGTGWAAISAMENPNGFDQVAIPWIWLGGGDTRLRLIASRQGHVSFNADFVPGPSLPPTASTRRLRVRTSTGDDRVVVIEPGQGRITLPVAEGDNVWTLTPLEAPVITVQANGDPRPLILGARQATLTWNGGPAVIR